VAPFRNCAHLTAISGLNRRRSASDPLRCPALAPSPPTLPPLPRPHPLPPTGCPGRPVESAREVARNSSFIFIPRPSPPGLREDVATRDGTRNFPPPSPLPCPRAHGLGRATELPSFTFRCTLSFCSRVRTNRGGILRTPGHVEETRARVASPSSRGSSEGAARPLRVRDTRVTRVMTRERYRSRSTSEPRIPETSPDRARHARLATLRSPFGRF